MNNTKTVKHTPGPWRIDSSKSLKIIKKTETTPGGYIVAESTDWWEDTWTAEANARLIAAAPDLLEALIQLREWIRNPGVDDGPENDAIMLATDAAIKKAFGQEEEALS